MKEHDLCLEEYIQGIEDGTIVLSDGGEYAAEDEPGEEAYGDETYGDEAYDEAPEEPDEEMPEEPEEVVEDEAEAA